MAWGVWSEDAPITPPGAYASRCMFSANFSRSRTPRRRLTEVGTLEPSGTVFWVSPSRAGSVALVGARITYHFGRLGVKSSCSKSQTHPESHSLAYHQ